MHDLAAGLYQLDRSSICSHDLVPTTRDRASLGFAQVRSKPSTRLPLQSNTNLDIQSFLLSTLPYTVLLPPLLLILIIRPLSLYNINYLPAGPTAFVFALLAQYHAAIPYMYKYQLSATDSPQSSSAINLTSKSTSYLLPLQLALSQLPGSAIVAAVGWLVGYAYRRDILPGAAAWRIPDLSAGKRERERFEGLRRRMEGEAATASGSRVEESDGGRRRTIGGQLLDQFRGS